MEDDAKCIIVDNKSISLAANTKPRGTKRLKLRWHMNSLLISHTMAMSRCAKQKRQISLHILYLIADCTVSPLIQLNPFRFPVGDKAAKWQQCQGLSTSVPRCVAASQTVWKRGTNAQIHFSHSQFPSSCGTSKNRSRDLAVIRTNAVSDNRVTLVSWLWLVVNTRCYNYQISPCNFFSNMHHNGAKPYMSRFSICNI